MTHRQNSAQSIEANRAAGAGRRLKTSSARRPQSAPPRTESFRQLLQRPIHLPHIPLPPVPKVLKRLPSPIPGWVKRSRYAQFAGRQPGWSAWLLVFAAVGTLIASRGIVTPHPDSHPIRYERWLEKKGSGTVNAVLVEIGPEIHVPTVRAQPINDMYVAYYTGWDRAVTFNSEYEYFDYELMDVAAHECVHAIFHQQGLIPKKYDAYFTMVNETAAEVLGAHIAGDVWSRKGDKGSVLTEVLIQKYRRGCNPANPDSYYSRYLAPGRRESDDFIRERWHSVLIHYGPLQLVDEIDKICLRKPDPIDAARAIANRFMRTDLMRRDVPILEEFRRRQRQWPAAESSSN